MVITNNYDLIRKIQEAKRITLLPQPFNIIATLGAAAACYNEASLFLVNPNSPEGTMIKLSCCLLAAPTVHLATAITNKVYNHLGLHEYTFQGAAQQKLITLSKELKKFNINTNLNLLLNSQEYKREYHLKKESIPGVIQTKFINIPVYNQDNEITALSLMQQHQIDSFKYSLSFSTPTENTKEKPNQKIKTQHPYQYIKEY